MPPKVTAPSLVGMKSKGERIVVVTAYDAIFGRLADEAGADAILVGDSAGMTVMGHSSTLPVNLDDMVRYTQAVSRGVGNALVIADMPFGSYNASVEQAVQSAVALAKSGAEAVKLEGSYLREIEAIVKAGIPVMGHVGMTPQSILNFGGPKIQGKGAAGEAVLQTSKDICEAGAFGLVLELIPADLASRITKEVSGVTIGIGAGLECDGEVQVLYDILGFSERVYKHTKRYCEGADMVGAALKGYVAEVRAKEFPTGANAS